MSGHKRARGCDVVGAVVHMNASHVRPSQVTKLTRSEANSDKHPPPAKRFKVSNGTITARTPAATQKAQLEHAQNMRTTLDNIPASALVLFTDGACKNNPGPCGAGAVLCKHPFHDETKWTERHQAVASRSTNNVGELHALGLAFDLIDAHCAKHNTLLTTNIDHSKELKHEADDASEKSTMDRGVCAGIAEPNTTQLNAHVFTDSVYSIGAVEGRNKAHKNKELIQGLQQRLRTLRQRHRVILHWCKGHAGIPGNERADKLANQGAKKAEQNVIGIF